MKVKILLIINFVLNSSSNSYYYPIEGNIDYNINYYTYNNDIINFICTNNDLHCSGNGICNEMKDDCNCNFGFISLQDSFIKCTYDQKKKSIMLLLEILIPLGFGHYYSENYGLFFAKFIIFFFTCYYIFFIMLLIGATNNSNIEEKTFVFTKKICCLLLPAAIIFYITDIILISINSYKDGNGVKLS